MGPQLPRREITEGEIAALADGALLGARGASVRRAVSASPELSSELAQQRRVGQLVRAAQPAAPEAVHASIQGLLPRPSTRRIRLSAPLLRAGTGGLAVAAAAAVIALVLPAGGGHTRADALTLASLAVRPAITGEQDERGSGSRRPVSSVDGISYPDWDARGWRGTGRRTDVLAGHTVTTLFYADARGHRIGYSIATGPPLADVGGSPRLAGGVHFRLLKGSVLTWTRAGRTCVLSGAGVSPATLLALASWRSARPA